MREWGEETLTERNGDAAGDEGWEDRWRIDGLRGGYARTVEFLTPVVIALPLQKARGTRVACVDDDDVLNPITDSTSCF